MSDLGEVYARMYPNFKPSEFACQCSDPDCKRDGMEYYFLAAIQDLRLQTGFPMLINSGFRCSTWNKHIGGVPTSYHLKGLAADLSIQGYSASMKHRLVRKAAARFNGIGIYPTFIHLDLRELRDRALWICD